MKRGFLTKAGQHQKAKGFVLPSAIFLLVILASLAAFLVHISTTQNMTSAQDIQGARAYQAARAGIEWGLYRVLDPTNTTVAAMVPPFGAGAQPWPNMPACDAIPMSVEGFSVVMSCAFSDHLEAGTTRSIRVFRLTATASIGAPGSASRIEREVAVTVSKCRARDAAAPDYACP